MDLKRRLPGFLTAMVCISVMNAHAGVVRPMTGGVLIDGYDFTRDIGPKGSIIYDAAKNEFKGKYVGLKMPAGRRAIFAWLHDTVNQKFRYLGAVGWLKLGTAGTNKGSFTIALPGEFADGDFGSYELIGFSSEPTNSYDGRKVVKKPDGPSGSLTLPSLKPAYYLFAALPGADTERIYCGHGQDFAYVKNLEGQTCYD